eukprot:693297-Pelagomonas_calceolata.AAC.1
MHAFHGPPEHVLDEKFHWAVLPINWRTGGLDRTGGGLEHRGYRAAAGLSHESDRFAVAVQKGLWAAGRELATLSSYAGKPRTPHTQWAPLRVINSILHETALRVTRWNHSGFPTISWIKSIEVNSCLESLHGQTLGRSPLAGRSCAPSVFAPLILGHRGTFADTHVRGSPTGEQRAVMTVVRVMPARACAEAVTTHVQQQSQVEKPLVEKSNGSLLSEANSEG